MASILLAFTLVLIAKFQPYKNKHCNTTDMIMILALFIGYTSMQMPHMVSPMFPKWERIVVNGIAALIPVSIMLFLALFKILSKGTKCLKTVIKKRMEIKMTSNDELFAILNGSNYHTVQ